MRAPITPITPITTHDVITGWPAETFHGSISLLLQFYSTLHQLIDILLNIHSIPQIN